MKILVWLLLKLWIACSKPVLISNQVGIWREIEQDNAGIVAPDTLEGTTQLLTKWLAMNSSEKVNMGKNAYTSFLNRLTKNFRLLLNQ